MTIYNTISVPGCLKGDLIAEKMYHRDPSKAHSGITIWVVKILLKLY